MYNGIDEKISRSDRRSWRREASVADAVIANSPAAGHSAAALIGLHLALRSTLVRLVLHRYSRSIKLTTLIFI